MAMKLGTLMAVAALTLTAVLGVVSANGAEPAGAVYTLSNQPEGNSVVVFNRAVDGSLTSAGAFPTGGRGTGGHSATRALSCWTRAIVGFLR